MHDAGFEWSRCQAKLIAKDVDLLNFQRTNTRKLQVCEGENK